MCGSGRASLGREALYNEQMVADLDELRERISAWPEEERAPALFALEVIEDELEDRTYEPHVAETALSSPVV